MAESATGARPSYREARGSHHNNANKASPPYHLRGLASTELCVYSEKWACNDSSTLTVGRCYLPPICDHGHDRAGELTEGVKGPRDSFKLAPFRMGTREATAKTKKTARMGPGASDSCWTTDSPDDSSAPSAATNPSIANRPLTVSGTGPANAIASASITTMSS
jgi:hypothetical protein